MCVEYHSTCCLNFLWLLFPSGWFYPCTTVVKKQQQNLRPWNNNKIVIPQWTKFNVTGCVLVTVVLLNEIWLQRPTTESLIIFEKLRNIVCVPKIFIKYYHQQGLELGFQDLNVTFTTQHSLNSSSQCHAACFNSEISTCCLTMFTQSRRSEKCINWFTYHMHQNLFIYIFKKLININNDHFYNSCFNQNGFTTTIPTKSHKTIEFSMLFDSNDVTGKIKLYETIFVWEYVHTLYSSETKDGDSKVALGLKQKCQRCIRSE